MSTGAGFSFLLVFLIVADCSKRLELQKPLPPFKTWIPSRPPISLKLLGKLCKEEEAAVELCMQQSVLKSDTGYTIMHTSSLPQPHPTETESTTVGLDGSGSLAQYQIRFLLMQ